MARTAKAPTALTRNTGVDSAAAGVYTTIDSTLVTNGLSITGAGADRRNLVLHVKNSDAGGAHTVSVASSWLHSDPTAEQITVSVPASGERMILLGDSADFEQSDETYHVDFSAGFTGSIAVLRV